MSADLERMHRATRSLHDRVLAEGLPVPRTVLQWASARSCLEIAERRAWTGDLRGAGAKLLEAVRLDPVRCGLCIGYRTVRSVVRRLKVARNAARPLHFYEMGTSDGVRSDPAELPLLLSFIEALDRRRLEQLGRIGRR